MTCKVCIIEIHSRNYLLGRFKTCTTKVIAVDLLMMCASTSFLFILCKYLHFCMQVCGVVSFALFSQKRFFLCFMLDEKQNERIRTTYKDPASLSIPQPRARPVGETWGGFGPSLFVALKVPRSDHGINITLYKHTGIMI